MKNLHRQICLFLIVIVVTLFSGCSEHELSEIPDDGVILSFGDSLTAGVGVTVEYSYPAQLSKLTGLEVINAGRSGETTVEGLVRFNELLDQSNPDLIILLEGGNDILRNFPDQQTKNNLSKMIQRAQQDGIPLLLIGVPKKSIFSSSASFYQELSESHNIILDDETISDLIKDPSMKSDSVHFNQKGYLQLANNIHKLLKSSGAVQ